MKIQRITLTTVIDLKFDRTLDLMNPVAFMDAIRALDDHNSELGACTITREVLDVDHETYDNACCETDEVLREYYGVAK